MGVVLMHRYSGYGAIRLVMKLKGTLPPLVLQVLSFGPNHGYRIAQDIKERSKGVLDFKEGTLYPALHGLENEGHVESYEETVKGRTRRYYRITESGRRSLAESREEWAKVSKAVTLILKEA